MDLDTLRRTLLRRLESDRRFGISHLPPSKGEFDLSFLEGFAQSPQSAEVVSPSRTAAKIAPSVAGSSTAAKNASALFDVSKIVNIPIGESVTPPNQERSTQSRSERIKELSILSDRVAGCTRCEELAQTRTQIVFGVGNPEAAILFLGEAPGADEDRTGEPFVGRAGQLLNKIISACRLTREEIYIANILKCRPPGNRNPSPVEATNCREYLSAQIATVDPDYIVCWGRIAVENLLGTKEAIGKLRQKFLQYGRAKVAVTYHPSYLLRNPAAKKDVWEDMKWLFRDMDVDLDPARK